MTAKIIAFVLYFIIIIGIGVYFYIRTRGGDVKDYFLGGRGMNSWVTALSAQASDMSAWLLMGLPGSILALGVGQVWIAIGLLIGTYLNWKLTAPRLRKFSKAAGDSITIPEYLSNRFLTANPTLRAISGLVFLVCFAVYCASSFKACGILFNTVFGMDQTQAVILAAIIIFAYTFLGGFAAVCWTDFIQGSLMLIALLLVPMLALGAISGVPTAQAAPIDANYWNLLPSGTLDWSSLSTILNGLAWGLGYFGMPHILIRFMSIKSPEMIRKSRKIAMIWVVLALGAAVAVGLVGRVFLPDLPAEASSTVFIQMTQRLLPAFIAGILLSGILAASMSTADSQLLVSASAFASDIYKPIFRKEAANKEMMLVSRLIVLAVSFVALLIAINPNSGTIMNLVENAWAGFGSAFGPVIILTLFWKRFSYKGAIAGIVGGALTDVLWLVFLSSATHLYELIPGFIVGFAAAVIGTRLTEKPSPEVGLLFDRALNTVD
jgi:sodium/proline symporter